MRIALSSSSAPESSFISNLSATSGCIATSRSGAWTGLPHGLTDVNHFKIDMRFEVLSEDVGRLGRAGHDSPVGCRATFTGRCCAGVTPLRLPVDMAVARAKQLQRGRLFA